MVKRGPSKKKREKNRPAKPRASVKKKARATRPPRWYTFALPVWAKVRVIVDRDDVLDGDSGHRAIRASVAESICQKARELIAGHFISEIDVPGGAVEQLVPAEERKADARRTRRGGPPDAVKFACTVPVRLQGQFTFSEDEVKYRNSDEPEIKPAALRALAGELRKSLEDELVVESLEVIDDGLDSVFLDVSED